MSDDDETTPADDQDAPVEAEASTDEAGVDEAATSTEETAEPTKAEPAKAEPKAGGTERKVTRRTVVSRRVTPKGGEKASSSGPSSKARDARKTETVVTRTPPPSQQTYPKGPSPWWVPTLMFALLIIGALVIMLNYMVGDTASNTRLVIGLAFILGGIITATQYR